MSDAVVFLKLLRPQGPWLLTAIEPNTEEIETSTLATTDEISAFVTRYNGKRNIYYSVNPTRTAMNKKAAKTDLAVIEYVPSDLDPRPSETPEAAKARYLAEIDKMSLKPTAVIDSGNGLNLLLKLAEPIVLPEPVMVERRRKQVLAFPEEAQKQIDAVEDRAKRLMETLGSIAGTQNIDRILRLPGTTNLPNAKKLKDGRTPCQATLIKFNGATFRPEDFPAAPPPKDKKVRPKGTNTEPTQKMCDLLAITDQGAGVKHGQYESRSAVLFAFLMEGLRANFDQWLLLETCLDDNFKGGAIYAHCYDQKDPEAYLERQFERAEEKYEESDSAEIMRLLALSLVEYDQTRKQAAKDLGVRVKVLDGMVEAARARQQQPELDKEIAEINASHALVIAGNKAAIMKFEGAATATKFRLLQIGAFTTWFGNQFVRVGKESIPLGSYWLGHPERRQYDGIEFAPPGSTVHPGHYNLWQGFAVDPRKGDCSKFLAHLKDNAARGDHGTFLWQFGWWAQIFQHPNIKTETGLALRGEQGTGKTKIGEVFGALLGEHYLLVASPRYITGQFNSHTASLLVLQGDEAFWAGDKKAEGILKDLVSGKDHMLEYKGVDQIRIKNFIRLYVTGNLDWMIPAGFRDRRWAIFDIGEDHMQDHAYFAAIDKEMANGGREALLYELLNFDLSQVDLRTVPKTTALLDQQVASMTPEQSWFLDLLTNGVLPTVKGLEANAAPREALHGWYVQHAQWQGVAFRSSQTKLGIFLKKHLGADLVRFRPDLKGERPWCYRLPELKLCRVWFANDIGQDIDWGEDWQNQVWRYQSWNPGRTLDIPVLPTVSPSDLEPVRPT